LDHALELIQLSHCCLTLEDALPLLLLDPTMMADLLVYQAPVHRSMGDLHFAKRTVKQALQLQPHHPHPHYGQHDVLFWQPGALTRKFVVVVVVLAEIQCALRATHLATKLGWNDKGFGKENAGDHQEHGINTTHGCCPCGTISSFLTSNRSMPLLLLLLLLLL
jgi:hypothetical protein